MENSLVTEAGLLNEELLENEVEVVGRSFSRRLVKWSLSNQIGLFIVCQSMVLLLKHMLLELKASFWLQWDEFTPIVAKLIMSRICAFWVSFWLRYLWFYSDFSQILLRYLFKKLAAGNSAAKSMIYFNTSIALLKDDSHQVYHIPQRPRQFWSLNWWRSLTLIKSSKSNILHYLGLLSGNARAEIMSKFAWMQVVLFKRIASVAVRCPREIWKCSPGEILVWAI